ncbi:MAG: hypothetical protein WC378_05285 [Opitutaceae bacterium]|jgi:hypothetical protein
MVLDIAKIPDSALAKRPLPIFDVPVCDNEEWTHEVSEPERARVREVFRAFRDIASKKNNKAGAAYAAAKRRGMGRGWKAKTLADLYRAYTNGGHKPGDYRRVGAIYAAGDWRVLLRDWKPRESLVPEVFRRWLNEEFAQFRGRSDCARALWRHVIFDVWLKDKPIPGYGIASDWYREAGIARPHPQLVRPQELPSGWSESNFRRFLPKSQRIRKELAHGYLAAHGHQAHQVLTDRSEILPLQYVMLDDNRPDMRCVYFNNSAGEIVYPLLVLGLDVCSGVDLANCAKPRALQAREGDKKHGVTQDMALLVLCNILRKWGLPPWPITFIHERAAACVSPEVKRQIEDVFGDRIQFMETNIYREKMTAHGFVESGGMPYMKAHLESFFRIFATQTARLPGSTGPRYDAAPRDGAAIESYTLKLLERAKGIESVIAQLKRPLLDFNEAHEAIEKALSLLRFRINHSLQGFSRVREWRRSTAENYQPWESFLALPADEQNAITDLVDRLECPAERFCRLLSGVQMTPVDPNFLTWLAGPRHPKPVRIRDGKIRIDNDSHGDDKLVFWEPNCEILGEEGEEFEAVISRDGNSIVLAKDGRVVGNVARQGLINFGDREARLQAAIEVHKTRTADREMLRGYYLAGTDEALADMRRHNEAVLANMPSLPATQRPRQIASHRSKPTAAQTAQRADVNAQVAAAARAQAEEIIL